MTRTVHLLSFAVVCGIAIAVGGSVAGGSADATTMAALAAEIRAQTGATGAALALASDVWVPRVAGLGLGLAVGLFVGGASAYATWGGRQ